MADTETFQHYQVLKHPDGSLWELGRGAMGVTYKAFDTNLRCHVALKVINAAFLDSDMARQRFLREARAAAGLSHHNVASVFHLGEEGGNYFYAMEFIDGETLEAFVRRRGPLPHVLALKITLQVARALRAASREGLVHRDIKPANLMLLHEDDDEGDGEDREFHVKVIDFGLAKVSRTDGSEASATITVAGFVGTPHFASPEQLEEKDLDVRSDIYSLGVTLWYMLTGRPPFGGSMVQIMSQHLTRPPSFEQLEGMPPEIVRLLERMLEKDPAKRPQTASELRREIEAALRTMRDGRSPGTETIRKTVPDGVPVTNAPLESSFPTEALADGNPHASSSVSAPEAALATGTVLAGRYKLLKTVMHGAHGTLFQALALDSGRPVALKVLPKGTFEEQDAFQRAEAAVSRARSAPHPSLLEIYALERSGSHTFFTCEWVNGFTLVDLLRQRRDLPVEEVLLCLEPLAAASDHAGRHGLRDLNFSPAEVLLAFEATLDLPARSVLINTPLSGWPAFRPKIYPLSLDTDGGGQPESTWAGLQTIVPGKEARPDALRQLALLAYELLGGAQSNLSTKQGRPPLPALTESGNAVLRQALSTEQPPAFQSAGDFIAALRASGETSRAQPASVRPGRAVPAASVAPHSPTVFPSASPASVVLPPPLPPISAATSPKPVPKIAVASPGQPVAQVTAAHGSHSKARGPLLAVLLLLVGLVILGIVGGASFAAWKIFSMADDHARTVRHGSHQPSGTASPVPTASLAVPTASPVVAASTPPPPAPPLPTPDRARRAREMLSEADALERNGDDAGALGAYVRISEDYPESDPGLSRLDSFVTKLRGRPATGDAATRRVSLLRTPMEHAAKLGSDAAMLYLGDHLLPSEPEVASEWYRQAADKGQPEAMLALGDMYFRGVGVPLEPSQAASWYQLASDKGFPKAKVYLAECYELGKAGLNRDYAKAFQLLNEALAIEPNNATAMEKLAEAYERGRGTAPDAARAFGLMKRAVDLGNTAAIGNLGVYYIKGVGQKTDARMAFSLFKQGVEKNSAPCMFFYAQCLEKGIGVGASPGEAVGYYRASAERGFPPARDWCSQHRVSFVPANQTVP